MRLTLLTDRNYSVGLLLVTLFGMLNFSVIVLLPPLLQQHAGFPDSAIGEIVGARGIGSAIGFFAAMPMARLDPRISMIVGALLQAATGVWLMSLDLNVDLTTLILCSGLQGLSIGVLWVPMTVDCLLHAGRRVARRGPVDLPPAAQFRLEPVHLDRGGRDRAHPVRQLRAHGGARLAVQSRHRHCPRAWALGTSRRRRALPSCRARSRGSRS